MLRGWGAAVESLPDDTDSAEATIGAVPRRLRVFIGYKHEVTPDEPLALALALRASYEVFIDQAPAERGPFGDHLRYHLFRLHGQTELVQGLVQVLEQGRCENETVFWRLHGAGLVRGEFQHARMRNLLYASFFSTHLKYR